MTSRRSLAALVALVSVGASACRRSRASTPRRAEGAPDEAVDGGVWGGGTPSGREAVPVGEGTQPRWRHLAHGPRPRGTERWRFDLTPREASGEPATDGRTVYLAAARTEPEGPTDGEVFALDLGDGTVRWHTPVLGVHGDPVEYFNGTVLVDTVSHCVRRGLDTPGVTTRPCVESGPGGVVGLDAATGRQRFRTSVSSEILRARWSAQVTGATAWIHDGVSSLRAVNTATGLLGARVSLGGSCLAAGTATGDLLFLVDGHRGSEFQRRAADAVRPRWSRPVPFRGRCAPVSAGPLVIVPAFATATLSGAPRALRVATGADHWTGAPPPQTVESCGALDNGVYYQVVDAAVTGWSLADGRRRGRLPVLSRMTSDAMVVLDGVAYLSVQGRLLGIDTAAGYAAVTVQTEAALVEGMVLWGGRGAVATRQPGLVVGFE